MASGTVGVCPPAGQEHAAGPLQRHLTELLKLAPSSLMGVIIPLEALLSAATPSDTAEYRVPAEFQLVVFEIFSSYRSTLLATEPVLNANITALDLAGLTEARLQNCLTKLKLKDRKLDVIEGADLNLAALLRHPAKFGSHSAPLLLPPAQTLEATFTLQDATAAVIGNPAYYGLVLVGALIPLGV